MTVDDFNADGKQDIIVSYNFYGTLRVLLGNGDGTFSEKTRLLVENGTISNQVVTSDPYTAVIFFGDGYGQFQRYRILLTAYSGYTTMISTDDFITNYFARIYDLYFALLLMSQYKRKITYTIDNDLEDNVNELHHLSKPVELDEYQLIEHRYFAVEQQTQQNNQLLHLIT